MGEILLMLLTGGGSTAMGAMLKGVFGFVFESKRQKHELNSRAKVEQMIISLDSKAAVENGDSESVSYTRRFIAFCGIGTYCLCILLCTVFPQAEFISITNATGEGRTEWLFGLSPIHLRKIQSSSLLGTSPIWAKHPFVLFWDSTSDPAQDDK